MTLYGRVTTKQTLFIGLCVLRVSMLQLLPILKGRTTDG